MVVSIFYEPAFSFADLDSEFEQALFGQTCHPSTKQSKGERFTPRLDLHENAESNLVTATLELPGLTKDDVEISLQKNILKVSGESKSSPEHGKDGYTVRERQFGKFSRSFKIPEGIKEVDVSATMEDGVLSITFPKSSPESAPKKVTIA